MALSYAKKTHSKIMFCHVLHINLCAHGREVFYRVHKKHTVNYRTHGKKLVSGSASMNDIMIPICQTCTWQFIFIYTRLPLL